ncbi:MAG TPA: NAD(P)-binding domain-containing protein, partial [Thermodesulfobacteriota bacterium]|nr:NAD(P)-binding domain-containing protein [Thermodesulfobacteriota bacterium]
MPKEGQMKTLGFVGLGLMGKPMAMNLMKGGYSLIVHDVNRAPVKELVAAGAKEAFSAKEVGQAVDVVITSLPDDGVVEQVVLGKDGLLEGMKQGSTLVETSTISPLTVYAIAPKLNAKGIEMLDAPLSGGEVGAQQASLSIMVGGKAEVLEKVLPALQKMGRNITHVGNQGAGQISKAANQIIVAMTIEAVSEALIFAKKAGADPAKVRKAMLGGFAQSRILEEHGQRMLDRNFKPGGRAVTHQKDIGIVLSVAKEKGIYLPGTMMVMDLWNAMGAHNLLGEDHTAMLKVLEKMSN